jgi:hypothetical protein
MERAQPGVNDCARFSLANHKGLGGQDRPGTMSMMWHCDSSGLQTYTLVEDAAQNCCSPTGLATRTVARRRNAQLSGAVAELFGASGGRPPLRPYQVMSLAR